MLIKTDGNRKAAYDSVINMCLKDPRVYCNACGQAHEDRMLIKYICCDDPQIGTNLDHTKAIIKQNKEFKKSRTNDYASNEGNNIRWGISIPRFMYMALDEYENRLSSTDEPGRRLFKTTEDVRWFARNYPMFAIPNKV